MGKLELSLMLEWDEENIAHIGDHGIRPEQVEELYYGEGPFPTLVLKNKRKKGRWTLEMRHSLSHA